MATIDAATAERGGLILRNGFALSALAQRPLRIINVRRSDNPPGLRPQHVQGVRTVRELCRGQVEGDKNNSTECALWPGALRGGLFVADIGTAGSCTLLVQMALPCLLFAPEPSSFCCKGGTDVSWSPPFDEMQEVFMPLLTHFGIKARLELLRRGLYPAGQGEVKLTVTPVQTALTPLTLLNPGKVIKINCWVWAAGKKEAGELAAVVAGARAVLGSEFPDVDVTIQKRVETFQTSAFGYGIAITLVAITDTGCRFGATHLRDFKKPLPPAAIGRAAAQDLVAEVRSGGCVDRHVQDQLILFMALAEGTSALRIGALTEHTRIAIVTAEALLPCRFTLAIDGETNIIRCDGVGLVAPGRFTTPSTAWPAGEPVGDDRFHGLHLEGAAESNGPPPAPGGGDDAPSPPDASVCVCGMPWDWDEAAIRDVFAPVGRITKVHMAIGALSNKIAFVHFASTEEANMAIARLNNYQANATRYLTVRSNTRAQGK